MKSKYKNQPIYSDGKRFASKAEAARYADLKVMQSAKLIDGLECQKAFKLEANGKVVCKYIADFFYRDIRSGSLVVEDVKGYRTDVFRLKKKFFEACYPDVCFVEIQSATYSRKFRRVK